MKTMTIDTRAVTADELLELPDDGARYELVQGELKKMSPAGADHGSITFQIALHLGNYVKAHGLGRLYSSDTGFLLTRNPDTVFAPDIAFVRAERVVATTGFFPGPPDLAIEVVSPSDRYSGVAAKTRQYLRAGTRAVVVVDPDSRVVEVHRASGSADVVDVLSVEDVVPGWSIPLDDVFTSAR